MFRSRRPWERPGHGPFRSRLADAVGDSPLRQWRLCREALAGATLHAMVLALLLGTLLVFAQSVWTLFRRHGAHLDPWIARGSLAVLGAAILLVLRRLWLRLLEVRELRRETRRLQAELRAGTTP